MKIFSWIKSRIAKPSSYAAVGVGAMGVGIIIDQPVLIYIGIAGGVIGFFLKEKGII